MSNQLQKKIDIEQYLDSFSFFENNKKLSDQYDVLSEEKKNESTFSKLIEGIKEFIKSEDYLNSSPKNAFICLLDNLHRTFSKNEGDGTKIKSSEINRENAFKSFKQFMIKDKSIISDDFFGIKLIEKKCKNCHITNFLYQYLKVLEIKVDDIKEDCKLDIEKCLKKMTTTKFDKNSFCSICSNSQIHEINIEIIKFPNTMILIFPPTQKAQFEISAELIKQKYELIVSKIKTKKGECFIPDFLNCCSNNIPLVLFYEKKEKDNTIVDKQDSFFNDIIDKEQDDIISKNNLITNNSRQTSKDELSEKGKIKGNDNDIFGMKNNNPFILYFEIENKEGKGMYIDTIETKTFSEIIKNLKKKYPTINFIGDKIYIKGNVIEQTKTPKDYKIPSESRITIKED